MHTGWSIVGDWLSGKLPLGDGGRQGIDCIIGTFLGGMLPRRSLEASTLDGSSRKHSGSPKPRAWIAVNGVLTRASSVVGSKLYKSPSSDRNLPSGLFFAALLWPSLADPPRSSASPEERLRLTNQQEMLTRNIADATLVVEPQSGAKFPFYLSSSALEHLQSQVLAGVGVRCRQLMKMKTINIYAFGLYVHPETLRAQLGTKYAGFSPDDLKQRTEFYDDLLRNEVNLSVRLVVLYKGLSTKLIRSAFRVSLENRLKKIEGAENDDGLQAFCSYLSEDISIRKGTVIDIHWQQGGMLHTVVDGRRVGTISSKCLCRAFFDLYIGDPPISVAAKLNIGESFAKMINNS